ncbi:MAG: response regulator [Calditrichae bacterium]|nr:response regulator [Calditrichia bacterium]
MNNSNSAYDILIVEDNLEQAHLTKLLVEEYGFKANFLTDSTQVLKTIRSDKPAMVILDLMMPELDGLRLCKAIKSTPVFRNTKVIIYSGKMYESDRRRAIELGADAFFIKPTRANMLIAKIKELLHPIHNGAYQN